MKKPAKKKLVVKEVEINPEEVLSSQRSQVRWNWFFAGVGVTVILVGLTAWGLWLYLTGAGF